MKKVLTGDQERNRTFFCLHRAEKSSSFSNAKFKTPDFDQGAHADLAKGQNLVLITIFR